MLYLSNCWKKNRHHESGVACSSTHKYVDPVWCKLNVTYLMIILFLSLLCKKKELFLHQNRVSTIVELELSCSRESILAERGVHSFKVKAYSILVTLPWRQTLISIIKRTPKSYPTITIYFHSPILWRQKATALSRLCLRRCAGLQRSHWRGNPPILRPYSSDNITTNLQLVRIIGVKQVPSPQCNFPFSQKLKSRKFCNDANPPTRVLKQTARTQQLIGEESIP